MTYTPEQQEAMAACLREIHSELEKNDFWRVPGILLRHGISETSEHTLAPWLAPPDDSVALDHPKASGSLGLHRAPPGGHGYYYSQHLVDGSYVETHWHPTEEAARKQWNRICRSAK